MVEGRTMALDAPVIRIHPADDVVIARRQLLSGTVLPREGVTVSGLVPPGHKIAVRAIADRFRRDIHPEALAPYPNVDGVVALTHGGGCATASDGEPLQLLRRTLGGYARHANFAAILVVGLGCETNQIAGLMEQEGLAAGTALHTFNIQDTGGTSKTVAHGVELVQWLLEEANRITRQPAPASHITVGL